MAPGGVEPPTSGFEDRAPNLCVRVLRAANTRASARCQCRGNNGNARRSLGCAESSLARRIPLNDAAWTNLSELGRTAAPTRQAGGHWFESSTAHFKACKSTIFVVLTDGNVRFVATPTLVRASI